MSDGEPLLVACDVRRDYHMGEEWVHAVRGVSLTVARGESIKCATSTRRDSGSGTSASYFKDSI